MTWVMTSATDSQNQAPKFKCLCEEPTDMLTSIQSEDTARITWALEQYEKTIHSFIEIGNKLDEVAMQLRLRAEWLKRTPVKIDYEEGKASAVVTQSGKRTVLYEFYPLQTNVVA